jgi:hypothetical protein
LTGDVELHASRAPACADWNLDEFVVRGDVESLAALG